MNNKELRMLILRLVKLERMLKDSLRPPHQDMEIESYETEQPIPMSTIMDIEEFIGHKIDFMGIT